jgi:DNA-binding MarR family transcriptional regulator
MTIRAMNWAWEIELPPALKLVLLKLADRANDDGECWPGSASIAKACGIGARTLVRHLAQLEELGLIKSTARYNDDGKRTNNIYQLDLDGSLSANLAHGLSAKSCTNHVPTVAHDKELKLFIEPTVETTDATTTVAAPAPSPEPIAPDPVTFDGVKWTVDNAVYDQWIAAYTNGRTALDTEDWIEQELAKAAIWLQANPRKRKKNYLRFLTGWLTRAADSMRQRAYPQQPRRPYH